MPSLLPLPLLLADDGLDARKVAARIAQLQRRVELAERLLNAHPEELILEIFHARVQIVDGKVAQFGNVDHDTFSSETRIANFLRTGSFEAATGNASPAPASSSPHSSTTPRLARISPP